LDELGDFMAEMRSVSGTPAKAGRRGPISKQGLDHLEIHPHIGGGVSVQHHYVQMGGAYKPPVEKKFADLHGAAAHIAGMEPKEKPEPGGKEESDSAPERVEHPKDEERSEEGED
jgi:hypothetical protein